MAAYGDKTVCAKGATDLMKRAHRRIHFAIWAVLGPVMFWVLVLALLNRPDAPTNDTLPSLLIEEAS